MLTISKAPIQRVVQSALMGTLLTTVLLNLSAQRAIADEPKPAAASPIELTLSPAAEPVPALRYHLLPPSEMRVRGNAVPIYLRLAHETNDAWKERLNQAAELLNTPFDKLDLAAAEEALSGFEDELAQISAAGRRSDADWEYVLDVDDPAEIRLGDAQFMRAYARLVALNIRYQIRRGDLPAALASIEDGMALGEHTAGGPFLVNQLIGMAICSVMLEQVDLVVQQPGAPNLYWALAALPRPLISLQPGYDVEARFLDLKFPELRSLDRPRSEEQWRILATAMRDWAVRIASFEAIDKAATERQIRQPASAEKLTQARAFLREQMQISAEKVQAMSEPEVEVRYTTALYRESCDAWRKWNYLPYSLALPGFKQRNEAELIKVRRQEFYPLASLLAPAGASLQPKQAARDGQVARAMVVEALRMHAAVTGKLPDKLNDVTVVPVPPNPLTGTPFSYRREGEAAILDVADDPYDSRESMHLPVTIRLRATDAPGG